MKILNKILILGSLVLGAITSNSPSKNASFNEYAWDLGNNAIHLKVRNELISEEETVDVSRTFVQYGIRESSNNYVLRFATAVKGPIEKITYTRTAEGLEDAQKNVTHVYQGILSNGSTVYYNPDTQDVTTDEEYKGLYYWACYTVEYYADSTATALDLTVSATVVDSEENEVVSTAQTTSLEKLLEANKKEYTLAGQVLEDTYIASDSSSSKKADNSARDSLALNSKYYRVFYKIDVSDILDNADFDANSEEAQFVLDIGLTEGADALNKWKYNLYGANVKYGDEYTAGISFNNVTWNTVQTDSSKIYTSLNTNSLNKIFKEDTIKNSKNLSNENGKLQIKLTYNQIKDYICLDDGEHYGKVVFMFNASKIDENDAPTVKIGSLEHKSLAPVLSYVYKK